MVSIGSASGCTGQRRDSGMAAPKELYLPALEKADRLQRLLYVWDFVLETRCPSLCVHFHELVLSNGAHEREAAQMCQMCGTYEIISLKLLMVLSTSERSVT